MQSEKDRSAAVALHGYKREKSKKSFCRSCFQLSKIIIILLRACLVLRFYNTSMSLFLFKLSRIRIIFFEMILL